MMKGTPCSRGNYAPRKTSSITRYVTCSTIPAKRVRAWAQTGHRCHMRTTSGFHSTQPFGTAPANGGFRSIWAIWGQHSESPVVLGASHKYTGRSSRLIDEGDDLHWPPAPLRGMLGGPDTIRTCDLRLRRATLYPAELRVRPAFQYPESGPDERTGFRGQAPPGHIHTRAAMTGSPDRHHFPCFASQTAAARSAPEGSGSPGR
jgi:hypothetical protein